MPKEFFRPVNPWIVNQPFGANQACVLIADGVTVITCDGNKPPKGYRSLYGAQGHKGVDLHATHGQAVYAARDGIVEFIDTNPKTGLDIKIVTVSGKRTFRHIYEHLLGYQVKVGEKVGTGALIGWADNTGWSAGNHLHWQVEELIKGKWVPIDPIPLTEEMFALKFAGLWRQTKELTARMAEWIADMARKKQ